jgi:predicted homoserine dehydrogenase-like protein
MIREPRMNEIRIGVVGIGHLGRYHLQKYRNMPGCRIAGVADLVEERARKAAEGGDCEILTDHRGLLGKVDAVSIAVPTGTHYKVASSFLKAGVDVLLEKPIAATLAPAVSGKNGRDALELTLRINDAIEKNRNRLDSLEPNLLPMASLPEGSSTRGRVKP